MQAHRSLSCRSGLRLHIGGEAPHPDWKILNVTADADYRQNAKSLTNFEDNSVQQIYASHILEHFHYAYTDELKKVLNEWYRVLEPKGTLFVSVPDLEVICRLFCERKDLNERFHLMRVIYGGNMDAYDIHKVGFDFGILEGYLALTGFSEIKQVDSFGIFNDTSEQVLWDQKISLNVTAQK